MSVFDSAQGMILKFLNRLSARKTLPHRRNTGAPGTVWLIPFGEERYSP